MRSYLLLLTIMLLLLRQQAEGQQPVMFDTVHYNTAGSFAIGFSVFETDSGYLIFSNQKGQALVSQDLYTTKFDGGGGLVSETDVATHQQDDFGTSSPVARFASAYFLGSSRGLLIGEVDSLFLYKFDGSGDTLWSRFIATDTSLVQRATTVTSNGDLLLAGTRDPGRNAYIFHLDSTANTQGYFPFNGFNGEDVVEGKDGKWYLCGMGNQSGNYGRGVLVRSDTSGTELWRRTLTSAEPGWYLSAIALRDSGVVCLGVGAPDQNANANFALAIKYDFVGNIVWRRHLYESSSDSWPSWFHAGYEVEDGSLVLAGWYRSLTIRDAGLIVKLTADGDTLWHRFYSHYPGAAYGKDQIFWDVKPTSDGGMVLTGETNSDDYPYAQLWLLKLDSMGCLVPGCGSVGVEEYLDVLQPFLRVTPNPASDQVNLALDLPQGASTEDEVQVLLLDATGKLVLQQQVEQNFNQLRATMQVNALASGTYYLHLRDGKRWLAGSKLVVE